MKKVIKTALAASLLVLPVTGAHAIPPQVPTFWQTLMFNTWDTMADHRPCNGPTVRVCDGHI